jgi:tetratricopeptide (TPR) repeat protein
VAALTAEVRKRPQITVNMQSLGDIYFFAADYRRASAWYQRVLDVDPRDVTALMALGSAQFNSGNAMAAEKHWRVAEWLYPWNDEVQYDLGFLYQSQTPPDTAKMRAHWKRVIQIQPLSVFADLVAPYLK